MTKPRLLRLLEELKVVSNQTASFCLPPNSSRVNIQGLLDTVIDIKQLPQDIVQSIVESPTGAILFWGPYHRYLVEPPFPIYEETGIRYV
jgi:hypothetical protein